MAKTYDEINEKIKKGAVVVATAEEMVGIVREKGAKKAAAEVDVVTTGTFAPMCSSGVFLNFGQAKDKTNSFRLFGFGHRVYKNYDPRAKILKDECASFLAGRHTNDPLLDIALELEAAVLQDDYFVERKLYPNVDFYSGILYRALGIPAEMFTVMFAIGRMPGWIAQWREMHDTKPFRIGRPRQVYVGAAHRSLL